MRPYSDLSDGRRGHDTLAYLVLGVVGLLVALCLVLPVLVGLTLLIAWWLLPSVRGRGRDIRPLIAPAVGGWAGLMILGAVSGHSAATGILASQGVLLGAWLDLVLGRAPQVDAEAVLGVLPLALGVGPSLALVAAWKVARRPVDGRIPRGVAARALAGAVHPPDGVLLGYRADGGAVILRQRELQAHLLALGTTHVGKSTFLQTLIEGLWSRGQPVLVIDGKADPALLDFLRQLDPGARAWTPAGGGERLDLLGGAPAEFAAKLIDIHRWTEPHYRLINLHYALQLGQYFALSGDARTPGTVQRLLAPAELDAAADALAERLRAAGDAAGAAAALAIATYTAELLKDPKRRLVIAGLADRFATVAGVACGAGLDDGPGAVELTEIVRGPGLWHLALPGDTMPDQAAALGAWLLLDLARVAHYRRAARAVTPQAHVILDEVSAFGHGALHLEALLARARDAGIAVAVSTQALADVSAISHTLPDQLLANTQVQVIFHMRDREAKWGSSALGTREVERETRWEDTEGAVLRRSVGTTTAPQVPPHVLEGFGAGDAMLSVAATATGGERRLERFRVALPGRRSHAVRPGSVRRAASVVAAMLAGLLVGGLVVAPSLLARSQVRAEVSGVQARPAVSQAGRLPAPANAPAPPRGQWQVGNTDGLGVYLRTAPEGSRLRAWPDGTRLEETGLPPNGSGDDRWRHVRAPDGVVGWVKERYLVGRGGSDR